MKKKVLYICIFVFIVLGIVLKLNSNSNVYIDKSNVEETNNRSLAVYLENDNGKYDKSDSFPIKNSGYTFNASKSVCNGSANLSWNDEEWGLELENIDRENTKCYLYFDK